MAKSQFDKDAKAILENSLLEEILFYRYEYKTSWKHIQDTLINELKKLIVQCQQDEQSNKEEEEKLANDFC